MHSWRPEPAIHRPPSASFRSDSALALRESLHILRGPMYRSTTCHSLRKDHIGQTVTLAGWVNSNRDHHGVIFIDLRDRDGVTQIVFRPEENPQAAEAAHRLRSEDVIQVTGSVAARLPGT